MPITVQYKKYVLKSRGTEVLNTDFVEPVTVAAEHIPQVATDLANFTGLDNRQGEYHSNLEVGAGEDVIFIERDYRDGSAKLTSQKQQDPNFFWLPDNIAENAVKDRNPFVLSKFDVERMKEHIIWALPQVQDLPSTATITVRPVEVIEQELQVLRGGQDQGLADLQKQIEEIETQLNAQRQADQAQITVGELQQKIEELMETLGGVDDLVNSQRDVHAKLKEYSQLLGTDIMERAEKLKTEVEKLRTDRVKLEADLILQDEKQVGVVASGAPSRPKFALFLLVLPLVLAIISVTGFALTSNLYILALGFVGGILEALLFLAVNSVEPDINVDLAPKAVEEMSIKINPELQLDSARLAQIEQFFVNKAWLVVLKEEFASLQAAINVRLGEQNLGQIQQAKTELQTEFDKLQAVILSHEGKDIAPEEYLKLRRKLDMLKVEKAKLSDPASSTKSAEEEKLEKELELSQQLAANKTPEGTAVLPGACVANVNEKYTGAKVEDKALMLWDAAAGNWADVDYDPQSLAAIFVYLLFSVWERKPALPLALVDIASWVPASVQEQINARIEGWRNLGQVVIINAQK
jgi:hypothetical protein